MSFYPDLLPPIVARLEHVQQGLDLFISTDSPEKQQDIAALCANYEQGIVEIRLAPNRGRDIAPKLITFRDVYAHYDLFLHLHTKRSPHSGALAGWSDYLTGSLLGSPQIVRSILSLFDDTSIGLVFPQHLFTLRKALRWGFNYQQSARLLRRMGVELQADWPLDFPSGSMFWGRCAAIRPLLDLHLAVEDFPEEAGQVDGTLAHAIERCVLHAVETAGYRWAKVAQPLLYPVPAAVLGIAKAGDLPGVVERVFQPCLPCKDPDPGEGEVAKARRNIRLASVRPLAAGHARAIDVVECDEAEMARVAAGLALWQRRHPVEAARWPVRVRGDGLAGLPNLIRSESRARDKPAIVIEANGSLLKISPAAMATALSLAVEDAEAH